MDLPRIIDHLVAGRMKGDDVPHGLGWRSPAQRLVFLGLATTTSLVGLFFAVYGLLVRDAAASGSGLAVGAGGVLLSRMVPEPVPAPGRRLHRRKTGRREPRYPPDHEGEATMRAGRS